MDDDVVRVCRYTGPPLQVVPRRRVSRLKSTPWTRLEDEMLLSRSDNVSWIVFARDNLIGRTGRQCARRCRMINNKAKAGKTNEGRWTALEDVELLSVGHVYNRTKSACVERSRRITKA